MPRAFRAPPRIPTRADIDADLRITDSDDHARDHLLVAIAAGTGLRVHELVARGASGAAAVTISVDRAGEEQIRVESRRAPRDPPLDTPAA